MDGQLPYLRNFLFLQGMASQFFTRLGMALSAQGHGVRRINFNGGDRLFWGLPGAVDYTGRVEDWPPFLGKHVLEWHITDIVLFGDCRPLHRAAIDLAHEFRVRVHVFEEGYLRPNWITLEEDGVNARSSLPRDPEWFMTAAHEFAAPRAERPAPGSFLRRAVEDVLYNVATVLLAWHYRDYRTHRPWHPFVEYAGWLRRFVRLRTAARRRIAAGLRRLDAGGKPYFLFPLQLDCDTQIRQHSRFRRLAPAIEYVIASFALHAPGDCLLVIKEHPLDNGLREWRRLAKRLSAAAGIADRVIYLEGGDVERLVAKAKGVVTVNSTVGTRALARGVPCIALAQAIYAMPGLTFAGPLDAFWRQGTVPDPVLFAAFDRVLRTRCLVNGGFFSAGAIGLAVNESLVKLTDAAPQWRLLAAQRGSPATGGHALASGVVTASAAE